jgi:predicted secreted protein
MAQPTVNKFGDFKIKVGNGASPEVFPDMTCGFTGKSFELTAETTDQTIPDCDNPDAAAWTAREIVRQSASISGEGVFSVEAYTVWRTWFASAANRNLRVEFRLPTPGYWAGAFKLTKLSFQGTLGEKLKISVETVSDGEVKWTSAV